MTLHLCFGFQTGVYIRPVLINTKTQKAQNIYIIYEM